MNYIVECCIVLWILLIEIIWIYQIFIRITSIVFKDFPDLIFQINPTLRCLSPFLLPLLWERAGVRFGDERNGGVSLVIYTTCLKLFHNFLFINKPDQMMCIIELFTFKARDRRHRLNIRFVLGNIFHSMIITSK